MYLLAEKLKHDVGPEDRDRYNYLLRYMSDER